MQANVPAWLSQKSVLDVGASTELTASQDTTLSRWTVLVPLGTILTPESEFTDDATGERYKVAGRVATRPDHRPLFLAAAARLISDMQA